MQSIKCDAKGRLFLRETLREKYGDRFVAIPSHGRIILLPVPNDPVADLRDASKKLRGKSIRELKRMIEQEARRQVIG